MCNALNHSPGCRCGWGGDGHLGKTLGGYARPRVAIRPTLHERAFGSRTEPNAFCPVCRQPVFFYASPTGGRVFFDELGPPWPKHPCTDNPRVAVRRIDRVALSGRPAQKTGPATWMEDGWLPVHVQSSVQERGRHIMRCLVDEATGPREFKVFPDHAVTLAGLAVAAMRDWDESGRSVLSFVDLGGERVESTVGISRSSDAQLVLVRRKLEDIVLAAEAACRTAVSVHDGRLSDYERQLTRWSQHVSEAEAAPYWARLRSVRSRVADRLKVETKAERRAQERLLEELEELLAASAWSTVEHEFAQLVREWHRQRPGWRHLTHGLAQQLTALERRAEARRRDVQRAAAVAVRIEKKRAMLDELRQLQARPDLGRSDRRYDWLLSRWRQTGHFRTVGEADLSKSFEIAAAGYRTRRREELERVAAIREAEAIEQRLTAKRSVIAAVQALIEPQGDHKAASRELDRLLGVWSRFSSSSDPAETSLEESLRVAVSDVAAAHEARLHRERLAEQLRIVQDAEDLAEVTHWDPAGFERLSRRWAATGPPFDTALRRRLENAYLVARSPGFREAVRIRLAVIADVSELHGAVAGTDRAAAVALLRSRWDSAPWAGTDIGAALDQRYRKTVAAALSA